MAKTSLSLALAGICLSISAALHVTAPLIAGLHWGSVLLVAFGLTWFGLARSYLAGSDHWARAGIAIMIFGILGAMLLRSLGWAAPHWWLTLIIWADAAVLVSLMLFALRHRHERKVR